MNWYVARLVDDELKTKREVAVEADCIGRAVMLAADLSYAGEELTKIKRLRK